MGTEPIRTVLIPVVLAIVVAAGQAFIEGANTRGIILAVVGAVVAAAQEYARSKVVPLAKLSTQNVVRTGGSPLPAGGANRGPGVLAVSPAVLLFAGVTINLVTVLIVLAVIALLLLIFYLFRRV